MVKANDNKRTEEILDQSFMSWQDVADYTVAMFMDDAIERLQRIGELPAMTREEIDNLANYVIDNAEDKIYYTDPDMLVQPYQGILDENNVTKEELSNGLYGWDLYMKIDRWVDEGRFTPIDHHTQQELVNVIDKANGYDTNGNLNSRRAD